MNEHTTIVELAQALADPLRLSILQQLMEGPATVSELMSLTGQPHLVCPFSPFHNSVNDHSNATVCCWVLQTLPHKNCK